MSDVLEGYKMSEVGVIPEEWEVKTFGEITKIFVGKDLKEENFSPYADNVFKYPVYSNTVDNEGLYGYYNIAEYQGDSLTVVGRGVGLGTAFQRNGGYGTIGRLLLLFPDKNVDTKYISEYINHNLKIFEESSGIPQLTGISLAKYKIPLPPTIEEQQAIASALSDADALIAALEQFITKKRNIKQGAMQQLITGEKRLPGFSEEWEVKTLENITTEIGDGIHSTPQYVLYSDFFFVNGNNLIDNSIKITDNTMCVSEIEYNRHKKKLNLRTILLSINGTIGNIAIFNDEKVILGKSAAYINVNNSVSRSFIFYLLQSSSIKNYFEDELTGSTIRNLSLNTIRNTPILLPTLPEQQAIAQILSDMDTEIEALKQKRDKYKANKQGMMQELLTGKTRLV